MEAINSAPVTLLAGNFFHVVIRDVERVATPAALDSTSATRTTSRPSTSTSASRPSASTSASSCLRGPLLNRWRGLRSG